MVAPESSSTRLESAWTRFDEANNEDPRRVSFDDGEVGEEWLYGRRMSACLSSYEAEPSESLQLAVRSQHLCRWRLPRSSHATGRAGYLQWRRACAEMHADLAESILNELGYDVGVVERVRELLLKRNLPTDPEAQVLEDVACLVFLEYYAEEFFKSVEVSKTERILLRTWRKMSPRARERALRLELPAYAVELLHRDSEVGTEG